jgi:hypothetical protein
MRLADGACHCRHAAMQPVTMNGAPARIPARRYASGRIVTMIAIVHAAMKKLHHHCDRMRIANSEFSFIENFIAKV